MSDDPALPVIELGGIRVFDAREWFPYKGDGGAVVFRPRTANQIEEVAIHHDAVAFSGTDLNFNGTTVDEESARMQSSYDWHTKHWPGTEMIGGGWNWPSMGYHLYTFPSGRIYLVGEILTIRAHVAYRNTRSGGVVGAGDFTRAKPQAAHIITYAQATAFIWLVRGAGLPVEGHRTWAAQNPVEVRRAWGTSCPGETHETWIPDVRRVAKIEYRRALKRPAPIALEDDDMKPFLAWDRDRQRIYLIGPWGASWITTAKDVKKFEELYGKLDVRFGKATMDALDQKKIG